MEVSGQFHAPAALSSGTNSIRDWVGRIVGLDVLRKQKPYLFCKGSSTVSSFDHPVASSLFRLSYPDSSIQLIVVNLPRAQMCREKWRLVWVWNIIEMVRIGQSIIRVGFVATMGSPSERFDRPSFQNRATCRINKPNRHPSICLQFYTHLDQQINDFVTRSTHQTTALSLFPV